MSKMKLFKQAEQMYLKGSTVSEISLELWIAKRTLFYWKKQYDWDKKRKESMYDKSQFKEDLKKFAQKLMDKIANSNKANNQISQAEYYFPSKICSGYFGIKRFDRKNRKKVHMVSVSGLLETNHRLPNLDYNTLMKLTLELTRNYRDVEQLFRLMCFNVFAHNRDDHSKNFSFLFDDTKKEWHLSPAYDLTYSFSFNGEHATTINGEGKNPTLDDIVAVAKNIGLKEKFAKDIAFDIQEKCSNKR